MLKCWAIILAIFLVPPAICLSEETVSAEKYEEFFLWAGVKQQSVLNKASAVYILFGEVREENNDVIIPLKANVPEVHHTQVWLTLRVETINWTKDILEHLKSELSLWDEKNSQLVGLQIDFDANTHAIDTYSTFLKNLRSEIPKKFKISITGLMDWVVLGDKYDLIALEKIVDEIVIQTYQGVHTIERYEEYLSKLHRIPLRYKLGLVQNGKFDISLVNEHDPLFAGFVVFLINH